jgi:DNA-binding GntR family transcriptional regulator
VADAIRKQITAGELRPGDRVPAVRQLAADWQIARATAEKALTSLKLEGLVAAVAGVGTIVLAEPRDTAGLTILPVGLSADEYKALQSLAERRGTSMTHIARTLVVTELSKDLPDKGVHHTGTRLRPV